MKKGDIVLNCGSWYYIHAAGEKVVKASFLCDSDLPNPEKWHRTTSTNYNPEFFNDAIPVPQDKVMEVQNALVAYWWGTTAFGSENWKVHDQSYNAARQAVASLVLLPSEEGRTDFLLSTMKEFQSEG